MHCGVERHIILVAKIQLQHFLQRLLTFSSEITQINQYAGLLHIQWGDRVLQILKVTGNTTLCEQQAFPVKSNRWAKNVNIWCSQRKWAKLCRFVAAAWSLASIAFCSDRPWVMGLLIFVWQHHRCTGWPFASPQPSQAVEGKKTKQKPWLARMSNPADDIRWSKSFHSQDVLVVK